MCTLRGGSEKMDNPTDPNDVNSSETIWTNIVAWEKGETKWEALYTLQETPVNHTDHYAKNFVYGIVHAKTTLKHISGTGSVNLF
jgi:hypothetical protein